MNVSDAEKTSFQKTVYRHAYTRRLPWRPPVLKPQKDGTLNPYRVLVSEVMLQQTQASRVAEKYPTFITAFPTVRALARAPLRNVFATWQGLGYNRRAKFLKEAAEKIVKQHSGRVPREHAELIQLPGVGEATAHAVRAYAFNKPVVFVETNIRAVYIHHFFPHTQTVDDADILPLVERTLDKKNPRAWYNALMDYGVYIKRTHDNPARKSTRYAKQKPFEGSHRQVRGAVLRTLTKHPASLTSLVRKTGIKKERVARAAADLQNEGLVVRVKGAREIFSIAE